MGAGLAIPACIFVGVVNAVGGAPNDGQVALEMGDVLIWIKTDLC